MNASSHPDRGVLPLRLDRTPFAIVDFETTGIDPRGDRVVEVAVRRFDPVAGSVVAFDSLVNPNRPMGATPIHGIRSEDIQHAPTFTQLAPTIVELVSGAVLASYNVFFDARFLGSELSRLGIEGSLPQICLMLMKPLLGLGERCSLYDACVELGIPFNGDAHVAAADVEAGDQLLRRYLAECASHGILTFQDLLQLGEYPFLKTLCYAPLSPSHALRQRPAPPPLSRTTWQVGRRKLPDQVALRTYFDALTVVLADLGVTDDEFAYLQRLQDRLRLTIEQLRALHARAFLCIMMNFIGDDWLDDSEVRRLELTSACLAKLGWSPGAACHEQLS